MELNPLNYLMEGEASCNHTLQRVRDPPLHLQEPRASIKNIPDCSTALTALVHAADTPPRRRRVHVVARVCTRHPARLCPPRRSRRRVVHVHQRLVLRLRHVRTLRLTEVRAVVEAVVVKAALIELSRACRQSCRDVSGEEVGRHVQYPAPLKHTDDHESKTSRAKPLHQHSRDGRTHTSTTGTTTTPFPCPTISSTRRASLSCSKATRRRSLGIARTPTQITTRPRARTHKYQSRTIRCSEVVAVSPSMHCYQAAAICAKCRGKPNSLTPATLKVARATSGDDIQLEVTPHKLECTCKRPSHHNENFSTTTTATSTLAATLAACDLPRHRNDTMQPTNNASH